MTSETPTFQQQYEQTRREQREYSPPRGETRTIPSEVERRREGVEVSTGWSGGVVSEGGVVGKDKSQREEVQTALKLVLDGFKLLSQNRVSFSEAKEIVRLLNGRLNRSYEDTQCERFLESVNFKRDDLMNVELFTRLLLDNI